MSGSGEAVAKPGQTAVRSRQVSWRGDVPTFATRLAGYCGATSEGFGRQGVSPYDSFGPQHHFLRTVGPSTKQAGLARIVPTAGRPQPNVENSGRSKTAPGKSLVAAHGGRDGVCDLPIGEGEIPGLDTALSVQKLAALPGRREMSAIGLTLYKYFAYYLSFFFFGAGGALLNLFCLLVFWLPETPGRERFFQWLIHRHFSLWIWWLQRTRLFTVRYEGLERLTGNDGLVLVANHPGLMDVTYLLARLPRALCIFKPEIRRNPVLGGAARLAGYLANDGGLEAVRAAAAKAAAGHVVLIFPEGTRTRGGPLNPFRAGFAFVAQRARVPIQTALITCDSNVLLKGQPWWRLPRLPAHVTVQFGPRFPPPALRETAALVAAVETWYRRVLADRKPEHVTGVATPASV